MADYWQTAEGEIAQLMNEIPKVVVSRTLTSANWNNSTLINENVPDEIASLKRHGNDDVYVFRSASLSETLLQYNLYDELRIGIAPVILGSGRLLFGRRIPATLALTSTRQLQTGATILHYSFP